jgi:hypothetical protein
VNLGALHRYRGYVVVTGVILILWAAYYFLWPTYSSENYIDRNEVRLAVISGPSGTYELYQSESPRLLRSFVAGGHQDMNDMARAFGMHSEDNRVWFGDQGIRRVQRPGVRLQANWLHGHVLLLPSGRGDERRGGSLRDD